MKSLSQKSHALPREVMDLLSPRMTNGGPSTSHPTASASSRTHHGSTSTAHKNVAPLKFHKSISMSSTTSHQWKASHTSTPLPPMVPTYPKMIQKNIKNLKSNIAINNAAEKKDKKPVSVKPARKWLW